MKTESKFTPGPWAFKRIPVWAPDKPQDGIPHFEFSATGGDEWLSKAKANARLIAAAPDLLEACKEAAWALSGLRETGDEQRLGSFKVVTQKALAMVQSAIQNATGGA